MQRVRELIAAVEKAHPRDRFFGPLDEILNDSRHARAQYGAYERAFSYLDQTSWRELRRKAVEHFRDHRAGQLKQGFFNQLNDAFAYQYLVRKGCSHVRVKPENGKTCPDLSYREHGQERFCEVKSMGISKEEIDRRERQQKEILDLSVYHRLSEGFLHKLGAAMTNARQQITSQGAEGLVFVVVNFDDFTASHYQTYRPQLENQVLTHEAPEVFVKIGLTGTRHIFKPRTATTHMKPAHNLRSSGSA